MHVNRRPTALLGRVAAWFVKCLDSLPSTGTRLEVHAAAEKEAANANVAAVEADAGEIGTGYA